MHVHVEAVHGRVVVSADSLGINPIRLDHLLDFLSLITSFLELNLGTEDGTLRNMVALVLLTQVEVERHLVVRLLGHGSDVTADFDSLL